MTRPPLKPTARETATEPAPPTLLTEPGTDSLVADDRAEEETLPISPPAPPSTPFNPAPDIGRIVHYYANAAARPQAAIVSEVLDKTVHLTVLGTNLVFHRLDVAYAGDLTADGPGWRWPDYVAPLVFANVGSVDTAFPGAAGSPLVFGADRG